MYRQVRRRIKRGWEKVKCFTFCEDKLMLVDLPNIAVDCAIKISDDLLVRFVLDMFKRWRMYPYIVVEGFFWNNGYYNVGVASDEWLDEHFGDDDFRDFLLS